MKNAKKKKHKPTTHKEPKVETETKKSAAVKAENARRADVMNWTVDDVQEWLRHDHTTENYAASFLNACIDGRALISLNRQDLALLGIVTVGDALHLLHRIGELKEISHSDRKERLYMKIRDAINEFIVDTCL